MTKLTYWVLGLLMAILGWVWTTQYSKLSAIQQQLVMIQIDITRLQSEMMNEARVREIVEHELLKHNVK